MRTYWAKNISVDYIGVLPVLRKIYIGDTLFPFQVKEFRKNKNVVILPNGKHIAKAFFSYA